MSLRRFVAVLLVVTSLNASAEERHWLAHTRDTLVEAGDTVGSFWAPFGITVGGVAACGLGGVLVGIGAGQVNRPIAATGDYALLTAGAVVLGGGLTLLTLGVIKFVQRRIRLAEQYGH